MKPEFKFLWEWCGVCDAPFIRCPKCGNNTCNGTYGKIGEEYCEVCSLAYQYQALAYASREEPINKKDIKRANRETKHGHRWNNET